MLASSVAIARNPGQVGVASVLIKRTSGSPVTPVGQRGQVRSSLPVAAASERSMKPQDCILRPRARLGLRMAWASLLASSDKRRPS